MSLECYCHVFVPKTTILLQTVSSLEKDIAGLKKEIGERDETIGDKEKRIYDLKKKNQAGLSSCNVSQSSHCHAMLVVSFCVLSSGQRSAWQKLSGSFVSSLRSIASMAIQPAACVSCLASTLHLCADHANLKLFSCICHDATPNQPS